MEERFERVPLDKITPHPQNPRQNFSGAKFEELVASIKVHGVQQPIVLRTLNGNGTYQIVAGERRYRASVQAGTGTIPAMIRDLSDQAALDVMTIENLQREDLSEIEEAKCFQTYLTERGEEALPELAERTGIDARYIRRRVGVLRLPVEVLKAWEDGKLVYGHLEQFLRIQNLSQSRREAQIKEWLKKVMEQGWDGKAMPVSRFKDLLDSQAPKLSCARFKAKEQGCSTCPSNSSVQGGLFGDDFKEVKAVCMAPLCFRAKQKKWLTENWESTDFFKKNGTRGFRFTGEISHEGRNYIWQKLAAKCLECVDFITIVSVEGKEESGQVCIGKKACFNAVYHPASGGNTQKSPEQSRNDRVHRTRNEFYKVALAAREELIPPDDIALQRYILFQLLNDNALRKEVAEEVKPYDPGARQENWYYPPFAATWRYIQSIPAEQIKSKIRSALIRIACAYNEWNNEQQGAISSLLGVDLENEFRITPAYLKRMTIEEILQLAGKLKLDTDPAVLEAAGKPSGLKNPGKNILKGLTKKDLINCIMKGDLAGKVPEEIIKVK